MPILVIGGMGFLGSKVTTFLIEQGEEVIVMGRSPTLHRLRNVANKVKIVEGDKTIVNVLNKVT